jgi:DNA-binding NarL/FixJ family response regulator
MPKIATQIILSEEESNKLKTTVRKKSTSIQEFQRCKIILLSAEGKQNKDIAEELQLKPNK